MSVISVDTFGNRSQDWVKSAKKCIYQRKIHVKHKKTKHKTKKTPEGTGMQGKPSKCEEGLTCGRRAGRPRWLGRMSLTQAAALRKSQPGQPRGSASEKVALGILCTLSWHCHTHWRSSVQEAWGLGSKLRQSLKVPAPLEAVIKCTSFDRVFVCLFVCLLLNGDLKSWLKTSN